ncbi:MAG: antibiotic biosynthesis monooxygenase [Bacteroidota bacterium]
MIARIWKGKTKIEHAEAYTAFMKNRAVPDYEATEGFVKLIFLKRVDGDCAYFELITFWEHMEAIKNFAGDAVEKAKYYPEDKHFLLNFPETVTHFDVFAEECPTRS